MATQEQLKERGVKGGLARARQFTPEYQRWARSHVKPESLSRSGRKGYEGLVASKGKDYAIKFLVEWRRANPSNLERIVMAWLDEAGVSYQREVELGPWIVDFAVNLGLGDKVIECDSQVWHTNGGPHGEDREGRDADKDSYLARHGYDLLRLAEQDIVSGAGRPALLQFLGVSNDRAR